MALSLGIEKSHAPNRRISFDNSSSEQTLTGSWQPEHLFALEQSVAFFDFYQEKIRECDEQIETSLLQLSTGTEEPEGVLPAPDIVQSNPISFPLTPDRYSGKLPA